MQQAASAQDIRQHLVQRQDEIIEFLRRLVLAESPTLDPASQEAPLQLLEDGLRAAGMCVRRIPGSFSGGMLYARPPQRRRGSPTQLLVGHCDTVWPIGTLERMPVVIEDGMMRGPGVYDMKAGLTQTVFALAALHDLGLEPEVTPIVLINSDEETGSDDSARHISLLSRCASRVFVMEPSLGRKGRLKTARKGVGQFNISVQGKAAHAGLEPESGASAILELSYVIQRLFALNDLERGITVNVGTIDGGLRANVVAPESRAEVDVRVLSPSDARRIEESIRSLEPSTGRVTLRIEGEVARLPMERTPRNLVLWEAARRTGREMGLELEDGTAGGASDGNISSLYAATLDGLGAVGGGAHADHEFIYLDRLVERTTLLSLLLMMEPLAATGE